MAAVEDTITEHGGKFLVQLDERHSEDDPNPITVVIEFPTQCLQ